MAFNIPGAYLQSQGSLLTINFDGNGTYSQTQVLSLGNLLGQSGTLTANDGNGNGKIAAGETINHDNANIPILDPVPDLTNGTVQAVGHMSALVTGVVVKYPVLLVSSGGKQYLVYPDGQPGALSGITGTVAQTLTFYRDAQYSVENGVPCFAAGSLILTERGEIPVEQLAEGDLVMTQDNGLQPVRWIGVRKLGAYELAVHANLRPVLIRAGALGANCPSTETLFTGRRALDAVGPAARDEIFALFPELRARAEDGVPEGARRLVSGRQGRKLVMRHIQNQRALQ